MMTTSTVASLLSPRTMTTLEWVKRYEAAWRAPGTEALREVFAPGAAYRQSPFHESIVGLDAIGAMWERERDGPHEDFTLAAEVVAETGDTAVVRVAVRYSGPPVREYRDLWVVRFGSDGLCVDFEEWPFFPGQSVTAPRG
jgi:ketosteroid isomerase-like protein